jgi:hypothetical protein
MIFQYVFDKCLWRSAKEKGGGYPPFGFMASSCSVLAAEGTLVAGLNGDGDEHRPREDAYRPKRGEAAEDGEDQRNDRRVDPRLQEEGAKQVVHPGYDQRTPDGKADAGHRGPREPQPNAYRQPDESRADKRDGSHERGNEAPERRLGDFRDGEAHTAKEPLNERDKHDSHQDAEDGLTDG